MWIAEAKRDYDQPAIPEQGCEYHCRNKAKAPDSRRVTRGEIVSEDKTDIVVSLHATWLPLNKRILHLYQSTWQFTFRNSRSISILLREGVFSTASFNLMLLPWFGEAKFWDFEEEKKNVYTRGYYRGCLVNKTSHKISWCLGVSNGGTNARTSMEIMWKNNVCCNADCECSTSCNTGCKYSKI